MALGCLISWTGHFEERQALGFENGTAFFFLLPHPQSQGLEVYPLVPWPLQVKVMPVSLEVQLLAFCG